MDVERRQHPRFATSVPVGLRFPQGSLREGWGRILDLSAGGLVMETRFPIKVAGVLYVTFALQDGAQFDNLRARVIRVSYEEGYYLAGIAFDDVVDTETLRDVIAALSVEGGIPLSR
jgi:hypothetical protein